MKLTAAMGMLVLSASAVGAAYVVELSTGERLIVESHWEEGDRVHLMKGGVDLIYPKSRIVSLQESEDEEADVAPPTRRAAPPSDTPVMRSDAQEQRGREDLEVEQQRIEKHLLRVQAERFEAQARGDDPKAFKRLDREFRRTQVRRGEVVRELKELPDE
jgi:hypothetical protein